MDDDSFNSCLLCDWNDEDFGCVLPFGQVCPGYRDEHEDFIDLE